MFEQNVRVVSVRSVAENTIALSFSSPLIARASRPGQFINVRVPDSIQGPLLRRPFSVSRVTGDRVEILFNIVGPGTALIGARKRGDVLDVLGPLGRPFKLDDDFRTAIIVAGGLGIAPFPFLTSALRKKKIDIMTFVGSRSARQLVSANLEHKKIATDDGSRGFHGNVVELLARALRRRMLKPKIFGCGPTPMLRALSALALKEEIPCELSLEGEMACGVGLCQGCPVHRTRDGKRYSLMCTEGPTFLSTEVIL